MRKAKIVATIGPACASQAMIEKLAKAGVDVCRLNFSFGTHEEHKAMAASIRAASKAVGKPLAVMQDLQGPKIRVGKLSEPVEVKKGETIVLTGREEHSSRLVIPTTYKQIASDTEPGKTILVADGKILLKVVEVAKAKKEVTCKVVAGGTIITGKGINLPYTNISLPALTPKDVDDATFGVEAGVDIVCLSFVRKADDVVKLRRHLDSIGGQRIQIVCKIEKPEALNNLDAILDECDGVMVARGDLADEISYAKVPIAQKEIIRKANAKGKITIVATEMLGSMVDQPLPSRAEASDVANAIFDGTDCVMLSNETATGKYPIQAVEVMSNIVCEAEAAASPDFHENNSSLSSKHDLLHALCAAAADISYSIGERGMVVLTHTGTSTRILSKFRPDTTIFAATFEESLYHRMALYHNVYPILLDKLPVDSDDLDAVLPQIRAKLVGAKLAKADDLVIFLTGDKVGPSGWLTDAIKIKTLSGNPPGSAKPVKSKRSEMPF